MQLSRALEIFQLGSLDGYTADDLNQKYKELAKTKHPDRNGSDKEFAELREAYLLLVSEVDKLSPNSTAIKQLSKEEILDRYHHDTRYLQLKIDNLQELFSLKLTF